MLSIILPYRNSQEWIEETLQSIINQSYSDWEVIAIDDHSSDTSASILEKYQQIDKRIQSITNPGTGIIPALQEGLARSQGEYITRMDSDDIMPSGRLELMIDLLASSPSKTVVTGRVHYFSEQEVSSGYRKYENWLNERVEKGDHFKHIFRECVVASPNWITRKDDLIDASIFDNLQYPEDYSMVFQWLANAFEIKAVNQTTLEWREHPKRTSRNSDIYDQSSFFQLKLKWFKQLHLNGDQTLGVFGAGKKGKLVIDQLKDHCVINWYDLNHTNFNTKISNLPIQDPNLVNEDLLLIAVYPDDPQLIESFIKERGYEIGKNAWFV